MRVVSKAALTKMSEFVKVHNELLASSEYSKIFSDPKRSAYSWFTFSIPAFLTGSKVAYDAFYEKANAGLIEIFNNRKQNISTNIDVSYQCIANTLGYIYMNCGDLSAYPDNASTYLCDNVYSYLMNNRFLRNDIKSIESIGIYAIVSGSYLQYANTVDEYTGRKDPGKNAEIAVLYDISKQMKTLNNICETCHNRVEEILSKEIVALASSPRYERLLYWGYLYFVKCKSMHCNCQQLLALIMDMYF